MKFKLIRDFIKLKDFMRRIEIQPARFVFATFLSLLAALCEGISVGMLLPMAKGIINMDFGFVKENAIFRSVMLWIPQLFELSNRNIFIILLGIIFVSAVLKNILDYYSALVLARQIRKASNGLMRLIFVRYLTFGKQFFDRTNIGYLHSVLLGFSMAVTGQFMQFERLLSFLFMLIVYLIIMLKISWQLTLLVVVFFPILYYALQWLINKIKSTSIVYSESWGKLNGSISNILSCIPLVKLYSAEEREKGRFSYLSNDIERLLFSLDKKRNLALPLQEIIILTAILFLVSARSLMALKGKVIEIGSFMVYFYLLKRILTTFSHLNELRASLATVAGPMEAISEILDDKDKFFVLEGDKEFPGIKSKIDFNHLSFCYFKGLCVLNDLTFSIEKGKTTAIVGPTGAGKTTIISLLLRFYDSPPSSILIDGQDIRDLTSKSLRSHISLVSQDILLFNDTLRNNIVYGLDRKISEEELVDIAKKARLYDFIITLPDKFDTLIGDRGVKLSGGEKQRVAIARALLKGAEIVILDEATSSLDSKTERLIQEAINEAIKDRTAIVIAHRLSTIKNADKIIVIEEGRLIEEGTLNELLEKKGKFYEYWQEQKFY